MATAEVFVDDAVRGNLPHVCVETGLPASGRLVIQDTRGGVGAAVLLIFLGPIGWIVLLVLVCMSRPETLVVRLPYSEVALDRDRRLSRSRWIAVVVAVSSVIVAVLLRNGSTSPVAALFALVAVASLLFAFAQYVRLNWRRVRVDLDASRRWVVLSRVHPEFVRAVEAAERSKRVRADR